MNQIDRLVEERRAQAIVREIPKKVMSVAQELGQEVRHQGVRSDDDVDMVLDARPWVFPWQEGNWDHGGGTIGGLPTMDADEPSRTIGWNYDGLSSGNRFEARWFPQIAELTAWWFGRLVFKEQGGEILAYVPGEWEAKLDKLAAAAAEQKAARKPVEAEDRKKQAEAETWKVMDLLRRLWGYGQ